MGSTTPSAPLPESQWSGVEPSLFAVVYNAGVARLVDVKTRLVTVSTNYFNVRASLLITVHYTLRHIIVSVHLTN